MLCCRSSRCDAQHLQLRPASCGISAYVAVFWGIRLVLQAIFDIKAYLNTWWTKNGIIRVDADVRSFHDCLLLGRAGGRRFREVNEPVHRVRNNLWQNPTGWQIMVSDNLR
jgi:hypothetical protein